MDMNRRQFFKVYDISLGESSLVAPGMTPTEVFADQVRHFKLVHTVGTRSTCTYCSVGCDLIMYSQDDGAKNVTQSAVHIEGDADRPVNHSTLCPKGAGLLGYIHSSDRLKYPEVREAGSSEWKHIEQDEALEYTVKLVKGDRDVSFVEKNEQGQTANRWLTTGFLAVSAPSNKTGYITYKMARSLGILGFDNQARV